MSLIVNRLSPVCVCVCVCVCACVCTCVCVCVCGCMCVVCIYMLMCKYHTRLRQQEHQRWHTCELGDEVDGLCHHEGHLLYHGLHAIGEVLQGQKATHGSSHLVCQLRLRNIE